jgi:hypothetical protein
MLPQSHGAVTGESASMQMGMGDMPGTNAPSGNHLPTLWKWMKDVARTSRKSSTQNA